MFLDESVFGRVCFSNLDESAPNLENVVEIVDVEVVDVVDQVEEVGKG